MKKINIFLFATILALSSLMFSCTEKNLEPTLSQHKDIATSINNVQDLVGILNGAYNRMSLQPYYGRDVILYGEVRTDNAFSNGASGRIITPSTMKMGPEDGHATDTWISINRVISSANLIISKKDVELKGDKDVKSQVIGQAYAIRALAHYDLLRLYGQQHITGGATPDGIPYITNFKPEGESSLTKRNTVSEVKTMIYKDLDDALSLMTTAQNPKSKQFISTYAVQAIKARVALYFGEWNIVKANCEPIISSGKYSVIPKDDFVAHWAKKNPVNSIFEIAASPTDNEEINGLAYIYRSPVGAKGYGDVRTFVKIKDIFDANDVRASNPMIRMQGSFMTNFGKYPSMDYSDDIFIIRYEEVLLSYAEALARTSGDALTYLNMVASQRGIAAYTTATVEDILKERRRELIFEGFRFDDIVRNKMTIPTMPATFSKEKQPSGCPEYGNYRYAFPIPDREMNANPNMTQNKGY